MLSVGSGVHVVINHGCRNFKVCETAVMSIPVADVIWKLANDYVYPN